MKLETLADAIAYLESKEYLTPCTMAHEHDGACVGCLIEEMNALASEAAALRQSANILNEMLEQAKRDADNWKTKHNDLVDLAAQLSGCEAGGEPAVRSLAWQLEHKTRIVKIAEEHLQEVKASNAYLTSALAAALAWKEATP